MNLHKFVCCVVFGSLVLTTATGLAAAQTSKDQAAKKEQNPQGKGELKPIKIAGELKSDDPPDGKLQHPAKIHELKLTQGQTVVIRLNSKDFDAYLIVRDSQMKELAFNDDDDTAAGTQNSRLVFTAPKDDVYRIVATSFDNKVGSYELFIDQAAETDILTIKARQLTAEGVQLYQAGKLKEAADKIAEVLRIRNKVYPKDRYPQGHPELATSLNSLGFLLQAQGEYAKAETFYRDALAMREALYPKALYPQGHPDVALSLNNLAVLLQNQGEYAKAEMFYRNALAMKEALYAKGRFPQGRPDLATSLHNLASLLEIQGEYAKAETFYRDALAMREALYPKALYPQGHVDLALNLNNLGHLFLAQGDYVKAETHFRDALAMMEALYPKTSYPQGHRNLATSLHNLGALHKVQGEYAKAETCFRDALAMFQTLYPRDRYPRGHPDLAQSLSSLGGLLYTQGEYGKAESFCRDALAMRDALYPKDSYPQGHPDLAQSLNNLGYLFEAQGDYVKAETHFRDALAMDEALYPKTRYPQGHRNLATNLNNLGTLHKVQGEYAKAETFLRAALAMGEALYPKDRYPRGHPELAMSLNNLGGLLYTQGEYAKAETFCRDALAMREALYPKDSYPQGHPDLAQSLNNLGYLLQDQGEYAKAETYLRDALAMMETLYPKTRYPQGHPELASSLNALGSLLHAQGEYAKAETYFRNALAMKEALYPKSRYSEGHSDLGKSLASLGVLLYTKGEYAKAETYFRDALAMTEALYPKTRYLQGHPDLANSQINLGVLFHAQGEYAKAETYVRESLAMQQRLLDRLAESAAEAQALNYAASLPLTLDVFLSIHRRLPPDATAFDLVWQSRAPLTRILERRHFDMYASQDSGVKKLNLELQSTRQRLAHLLLSPAKDAVEHNKKLTELTEAKENLEKQLARQLGLNMAADVSRTSPQQLSNALPQGAAFIDVIRYTDFSWDPKVPGKKGQRSTPRYLAFVHLSDKPAGSVDLGEAGAIEKVWAAWREAIVNNRPDRDQAAALAALIWQPLRKKLPATIDTIWLAADGQLAQVPWAALPGAKSGSILLEELAIAAVPHGAFLLQHLDDKPAAAGAKATVLTVGGVAYDKAAAGNLPFSDLAPLPGDKLVKWSNLPGTASEQSQIAGLARKVFSNEPITLQGSSAGMAQVSAGLPKVRFAHLATHGFFADAKFRSALQVDEKQFLHLGGERKTVGARSPSVLSGLVLAGANLADTPQRGIMTAEAVVGLRLEDLELAVLSACETGLGDSAGGEGIMGLQRAFHVAGARNVVASRWRVDDEATAALMIVFYHKLWLDKQPPLQALRQAQLFIYRHPEQIKGLATLRGIDFTAKDLPAVAPTPLAKDARAHTSQWAAFVLSGAGK